MKYKFTFYVMIFTHNYGLQKHDFFLTWPYIHQSNQSIFKQLAK